MISFHPSVLRYTAVLEGAFQHLKHVVIVTVSMPVKQAHAGFGAAASDDLLRAAQQFSKRDPSVTRIRMVYEMDDEDVRLRA